MLTMSQSSIVKKDSIVTLAVILLVAFSLGVINYRNNTEGKIIAARQVASDLQITNAKLSEQISIFYTPQELTNRFPDTDIHINWNRDALLSFIGLPQPTPGYQAVLEDVRHEGGNLNIRYHVQEPNYTDSAGITVIAYPLMFVSVPKDNLVAGKTINIQFIETESGHTKSLKLSPNEI